MNSADPFRTPERLALRQVVRRFIEKEVLPDLDSWERSGKLPRELHRAAGEVGLLGLHYPEAAGGGDGDAIDLVVLVEEALYAGASGGLIAGLLTTGISVPHIIAAGDEAQISLWVRPTLAGDLIGALAITEPDGGSDVGGLRTTAVRDGDHYVVNGA
ncbi:MAG: acyl-CoA dehydrogenase family protein, partial [Actinobacteria bacterium]|nr:acyl-CoA dehydrogenase family protein [Actinomycetota bacterium]